MPTPINAATRAMPEVTTMREPPPPRLDDPAPACRASRPQPTGAAASAIASVAVAASTSIVVAAVAPARGRRRPRSRSTSSLALFGLRPHQPAIGAVAADQLGVAAALDDPAVVEHEDAVGADHARQPVRQDQGRAPLRQAVDRLLDHRLVLGVDRGSASSRIRIGASRSSARAIARRWRWPPDSMTPRSPIIVA